MTLCMHSYGLWKSAIFVAPLIDTYVSDTGV